MLLRNTQNKSSDRDKNGLSQHAKANTDDSFSPELVLWVEVTHCVGVWLFVVDVGFWFFLFCFFSI